MSIDGEFYIKKVVYSSKVWFNLGKCKLRIDQKGTAETSKSEIEY